MPSFSGRELECRIDLERIFELRLALRLAPGDAIAEGEVFERRGLNVGAGGRNFGRITQFVDRGVEFAQIEQSDAFSKIALRGRRLMWYAWLRGGTGLSRGA